MNLFTIIAQSEKACTVMNLLILFQNHARYYDFVEFPGVLSCVDGSHIRIKAPSVDEPAYVNRKGYHSINAMFVCNPNKSVSYVSARWPGSSHENTILISSSLWDKFLSEEMNGKGVLLGDSGYAQSDHVMTPLLAPEGLYHDRYHRKHKCTRVCVEQSIWVLISRCRCLHTSTEWLLGRT